MIGLDASEAVPISAKTGLGIDDVLEAIVTRLPPPKGDEAAPLKALLVDTWYDAYLGVVVLVRVFDGVAEEGQRIRMMRRRRRLRGRPHRRLPPQDGRDRRASAPARSASSPPRSRRWPTPASATPSPTTSARPPRRCPASSRCSRWCSAACSRSTRPTSRTCARRWAGCASTTPASPTRWRPPPRSASASAAASSGLLHLEIIQERLEREFNLDLIATAPGGDLPDRADRRRPRSSCTTRPTCPTWCKIAEIEEPWIKATILTPDDYLGAVLKLCQDRRGEQRDSQLRRQPRHGGLRPAAERGGVRLLRPAEVDLEGLRLLRLPADGLPRGRPGEDVDPGQRRAGRRALDAGPPRPRREPRPGDGARR